VDEKNDREAQEFVIKAVAATVFIGEGHQTFSFTDFNISSHSWIRNGMLGFLFT
jgi:hypothetical protein